MRVNRPAASAVPTGSLRTLPSATPGIPEKGVLTRFSTGRWRRQAAVWPGQPRRGREGLPGGLGVS
jgi:hypothetical protein